MHSALSDGGSDVEDEIPKRNGRGRKPIARTELEDDLRDTDRDDADAQRTNGDALDKDVAMEDDEVEEEADEYVVEAIESHMVDKNGKLMFEVKWEGYEAKSDRTWEPEDNLAENAKEILDEYVRQKGGRKALFDQTAKAMKTKKRARPLIGTPAKRTRRNTELPSSSEPPATATRAAWKPPAGSWEDHIATLDACEDEESGKLMVYLTWKNGHKTQHETKIVYAHCPQKMLQFYERHVRIIRKKGEVEADADAGAHVVAPKDE